MAEQLLSPHWYRISHVKPALCSHVRMHRHVYRDKVWYILHDETSGKHNRFNESAHRVIRLLDNKNTVNDIWMRLNDELGDDSPTQDEIFQLLGNLYFSNCLAGDLPSDIEEIMDRRSKNRRKLFNAKLANPLSIKFPLLDPDRFLAHWMFIARPLFSKSAGLAVLVLMLVALFEMWRNWEVLVNHAAESALQPSNIMILLLVYPLVKGLHELGHGFAVKHWGGEVHELGIMLLVFMPVPYVDASSSSAFRSKQRRMVVSAAGIIIELVLASVALLLWLNVQQGLVSDILFSIMLIGGVSTLLFNGNPLLKFDGYYVFADAIEIPGLGTRANKYIGYLVQRYVFDIDQASSPETADGERYWFVVYGIAAFIYRMLIMVTIILFIANKFFFIGIALGVWVVVKQLIMPVYKYIAFVVKSPLLSSRRSRAISICSGALSIALIFVFSVPMPLNTVTEGVVWLPEHSYVRAGSNGFVETVMHENGEQVRLQQPLINTVDVLLTDEYSLLQAQLAEQMSKYDATLQKDRVEAEIIKDEIQVLQGSVARMQERLAELTMNSPADGEFILPDSKELTGQYVKQGDALAYVINFNEVSIRVAVPQDSIGLVRKQTRNVEVRLVSEVASKYEAEVLREIPAATYKLPSKALAVGGGGKIKTDPFDNDGIRTKEQYFQFDLSLPEKLETAYIGQRVHVRFTHGYEALALQWYRSISELFLDELGKV